MRAKEIVIIFLAFSIIQNVTTISFKTILLKSSVKRPSVRQLTPQSSSYQYTLQKIKSAVRFKQRDDLRFFKDTPIFKRGSVYKFKIELKINGKFHECFVRINMDTYHLTNSMFPHCWLKQT